MGRRSRLAAIQPAGVTAPGLAAARIPGGGTLMVWARLDDDFPQHPKVLGLSDPAFRLHVAAICYSAKWLTNGVVPFKIVGGLHPDAMGAFGYADELVAAKVWDKDESVELYRIHDFLAYNKSREQVEKERASMETARKSGFRAAASSRRLDGRFGTVTAVSSASPTAGPAAGEAVGVADRAADRAADGGGTAPVPGPVPHPMKKEEKSRTAPPAVPDGSPAVDRMSEFASKHPESARAWVETGLLADQSRADPRAAVHVSAVLEALGRDFGDKAVSGAVRAYDRWRRGHQAKCRGRKRHDDAVRRWMERDADRDRSDGTARLQDDVEEYPGQREAQAEAYKALRENP